jgi:uncharacterized protein YijF (DUF1287 family)
MINKITFKINVPLTIIAIVLTIATGYMVDRWRLTSINIVKHKTNTALRSSDTSVQLIKNPRTIADKIVNGAKMEAIVSVRYDASYIRIPYPNGDVPKDQGVCTDVVIRAFRNAGYDLQKLIHEDMKAHFNLYPRNWGLSRPDTSIDHRRIPNQMTFFKRFGTELPKSIEGNALETWKPGDIVYWDLQNGHAGIISNVKNERGIPLVIHNLSTARENDRLDTWPIIGHFRYPKK